MKCGGALTPSLRGRRDTGTLFQNFICVSKSTFDLFDFSFEKLFYKGFDESGEIIYLPKHEKGFEKH